jgi:hypothetical protein
VEPTILQFWRDFVETLSGGQDRPETPANVFAFGDSKELAVEFALELPRGTQRPSYGCATALGRFSPFTSHLSQVPSPLPALGLFPIHDV